MRFYNLVSMAYFLLATTSMALPLESGVTTSTVMRLEARARCTGTTGFDPKKAAAVEKALTYIYGIGRHSAKVLLENCKNEFPKVPSLTSKEIAMIKEAVKKSG